MTPQEIATELVRAMNTRDLEAALALFSPDAAVFFPRYAPRPVFHGHEGLAELHAWLVETLPRHTVAAARIAGTDNAAVMEFEIAGTSRSGRSFDNVAAVVLDLEDGRIVSGRLYLDTADLGRILGGAVA